MTFLGRSSSGMRLTNSNSGLKLGRSSSQDYEDRPWDTHGLEMQDEWGSIQMIEDSKEKKQAILDTFERWLKTVKTVAPVWEAATDCFKARKNGIDGPLQDLQDEIQIQLEFMMGIALQQDQDSSEDIQCEYGVHPASSFTAGTHLPEESDLDFCVVVTGFNKMLGVENHPILEAIKIQLKANNFEFVEVRTPDGPNVHHVWRKFVEQKKLGSVEIEFKLRDKEAYESSIHKIHQFLDNEMPEYDRISIFYNKLKLKEVADPQSYSTFKKMYYEWANIQCGNTNFLY